MTASAATAAVIINLSKQTASAGFTIAGATGNYVNTITGSAGADGITGGSGDDIFNGYIGDDTINGASGTDTLVLTGSITTSDTNRLVSIENVSAATLTAAVVIDLRNESEAETITGGGGADTIYGGSGVDTISAGAGADYIKGGAGADSLTGGLGANTYDYVQFNDSLGANYDIIADFKTGDRFKIGHTIAAANLKTESGTGTGALVTDLGTVLTSSNFIASAATLVTLTGGSDAGRYLVLNDATTAFDATSGHDAVIKLSGAVAVTSSAFIA